MGKDKMPTKKSDLPGTVELTEEDLKGVEGAATLVGGFKTIVGGFKNVSSSVEFQDGDDLFLNKKPIEIKTVK